MKKKNKKEGFALRYLGKNSVASKIAWLLNVAWYLTFAAIVILVGIFVVSRFAPELFSYDGLTFEFQGGLRMALDPELISPEAVNRLPLTALLVVVTSMPVVLVIIYQLRQLFREFAGENPFTLSNAKRVRVIGFAVLAWSVLSAVGEVLLGYYIMNSVHIPGVEFGVNIKLDLTVVFLGFVVLVLAEIFSMAAGIKEEQDLTI